jgi:hypothetical protein
MHRQGMPLCDEHLNFRNPKDVGSFALPETACIPCMKCLGSVSLKKNEQEMFRAGQILK